MQPGKVRRIVHPERRSNHPGAGAAAQRYPEGTLFAGKARKRVPCRSVRFCRAGCPHPAVGERCGRENHAVGGMQPGKVRRLVQRVMPTRRAEGSPPYRRRPEKRRNRRGAAVQRMRGNGLRGVPQTQGYGNECSTLVPPRAESPENNGSLVRRRAKTAQTAAMG